MRAAPIATIHRRASLGSIGKMPSRSVGSPAITSRLNVIRSNSIERPTVTATSKLSLTRRTMSGVGGRTNASAVKTPTVQPPTTSTTIKRSTSMLRRLSSPAVIPNGLTTTLATRKTVATTKLTPLPSKVAKK